jgi:hypothetical protein
MSQLLGITHNVYGANPSLLDVERHGRREHAITEREDCRLTVEMR